MQVSELVKEYLCSGKTRMMQVATSKGDQPWACTVYYAVDDELNLIWISTPDRRHSEEMAKNPKVAGVIAYDQQPPIDNVRGIQFEGTAELLSGENEAEAAKFYINQLGRESTLLEDIRSGKNPHKIYQIKVSKFVLIDSKNFPDEPRQEWQPTA